MDLDFDISGLIKFIDFPLKSLDGDHLISGLGCFLNQLILPDGRLQGFGKDGTGLLLCHITMKYMPRHENPQNMLLVMEVFSIIRPPDLLLIPKGNKFYSKSFLFHHLGVYLVLPKFQDHFMENFPEIDDL